MVMKLRFDSISILNNPKVVHYASEEAVFDEATGTISSLPTPTVLVGIESEFVVSLFEDRDITTLTDTDVELSVTVADLADLSLLDGVNVEFYFDYNSSNVSMGTSVTDENGTANQHGLLRVSHQVPTRFLSMWQMT